MRRLSEIQGDIAAAAMRLTACRRGIVADSGAGISRAAMARRIAEAVA